jgi:hypothetical protein
LIFWPNFKKCQKMAKMAKIEKMAFLADFKNSA